MEVEVDKPVELSPHLWLRPIDVIGLIPCDCGCRGCGVVTKFGIFKVYDAPSNIEVKLGWVPPVPERIEI